jgi:hypothetical protein
LRHSCVSCDRQNARQAAFVSRGFHQRCLTLTAAGLTRIDLQQFVSVVIGNDGHDVPATTENLSSAGVLLYADQRIQEGSEVGLILVVPPVETEAQGKMWCFGKVLRVEKELKEGKFGMAIGFQRCQVLSEA